MEIIVVATMLLLVVLLGVAVKLYDLKRKREDEAIAAQARISDALLMDATLAGLPLTPTAHLPLWKGSPLVVEITGEVPRPELREAAVDVAEAGGGPQPVRLPHRGPDRGPRGLAHARPPSDSGLRDLGGPGGARGAGPRRPRAPGPRPTSSRPRSTRSSRCWRIRRSSPKAEGRDRRAAIRKEAEGVFDFTETAKRALGRHWQGLAEKDRQEFTALFTDLIERAYISKIERYSGERIAYAGEAVDGGLATVRTRFVTKQGTEVPVDYRMQQRGDRWLVYDVSVEGVSLINNYRTQFDKIIQTSSYAELVRKMKAAEFAQPASPRS